MQQTTNHLRGIGILLPLILLAGIFFIYLPLTFKSNIGKVQAQSGNVHKQIVMPVFKNIVFLGDSLTAGVGASNYTQAFPAKVTASLTDSGSILDSISLIGKAGYTARYLLNSTDISQITANADLVVVELGTNDYYLHGTLTSQRPTRLAQFKVDYEDVLQKIDAKSRIVCLSTWDGPLEKQNALGLTVTDYNTVIKESCESKSGKYINISHIFMNKGTHSSKDNFHPNDNGYSQIANAIVESFIQTIHR